MLVGGALPPAAIGVDAWPDVPVQVHHAARDSWVDAAAVDALRTQARATVFTYDVGGHLFDDPGLPEHDAKCAALLLERVLAFVA